MYALCLSFHTCESVLYVCLTNSKTAYIHATITHKTPAMDNAADVFLHFTLPSYVIYEQFASNGSRPPDDVTITRDEKVLSVTMKVTREFNF